MTVITNIFIFFIVLLLWTGLLYLVFSIVQNRRYRQWTAKQKLVTLLLRVPRNNEKTALSAEQMYASLHGILRKKWDRLVEGSLQEHVSFEVVSSNKYIKFYAVAPENIIEFLEGQLYAQYPTLLIERVDDYTKQYDWQNHNYAVTELFMDKDSSYPIRTFEKFDVDPLAGITAVLSKLGDSSNQVWIQYLVRPVENDWQTKSMRRIASIRGQVNGAGVVSGLLNFLTMVFSHILSSGAGESAKEIARTLTGPEEEAVKGISEKATKLGYEVKIRLVCFGNDPIEAKNKILSIVGTFKQYSATNINGFHSKKIIINFLPEITKYLNREFWGRGYVLNTVELASIFHLPSIAVETPAIVWSTAKVAEPPSNLPTDDNTESSDLCVFARTNFRGLERVFGIKEIDRANHVYIVGKTGMGKTSLLQNMVIDDVRKGRGVGVIDPHGDFVDMVMKYIPDDRINDVILFDPGDRENPVAFNLMENVDDDYKPILVSGLIAIFKKLWGESWGPRLEHILRYTFLALLYYPGSTFLSVPRMLTDDAYRAEVLKKVKDPVVRDFWESEFQGYPERTRMEAIMPIQNKVGQFLASSTVRNIVGQPQSAINIRKAMDDKKILLVKVSKGLIGEDNAALMGAMMITKIQLAAMSRADIPKEERQPFNLYVDEFQNFATESFVSILSEARKYSLNLHVANQYIEQMTDEVRGAIFGNVGTLITFRVGANDAQHLSKEFAPTFLPEDLVNLEKYHVYLRETIDGISSAPFSATTLPLPPDRTDNQEQIRENSRKMYGTERSAVELEIEKLTSELDEIRKAAEEIKRSQKGKGKSPQEIVLMTEEEKKKSSQLIEKLQKFKEMRGGKADEGKEVTLGDKSIAERIAAAKQKSAEVPPTVQDQSRSSGKIDGIKRSDKDKSSNIQETTKKDNQRAPLRPQKSNFQAQNQKVQSRFNNKKPMDGLVKDENTAQLNSADVKVNTTDKKPVIKPPSIKKNQLQSRGEGAKKPDFKDKIGDIRIDDSGNVIEDGDEEDASDFDFMK